MNREAMQAFIDSRIKPELQPEYPTLVNAYRAAWTAAEDFRDKEFDKTVDATYARTSRTVPSHPL